METAETAKTAKNGTNFNCKLCDFYTLQKSDFQRHLSTRKHQYAVARKSEETGGNEKNGLSYLECKNCNNRFFSNSGLWKHMKTCNANNSVVSNQIVDILLKQNQEYKELLMNKTSEMEQKSKEHFEMILRKDEDFKSLILEICKSTQTNPMQINNNTLNNVTNVNNTFNLNLFLNETCKDAMNLSDFIKGVKVSIDDIEHIGKVGYVDGLSDIIIKNLNELGIERRPIHCTDAKRQIVYVKEDNKWEKEDENMTSLKKMVCGVQHANFVTLKKWREMYPSCLTANSIYTDTYNTMSQELMGGDCEKISLAAKELKIISKVARGMTIDKSSLCIK